MIGTVKRMVAEHARLRVEARVRRKHEVAGEIGGEEIAGDPAISLGVSGDSSSDEGEESSEEPEEEPGEATAECVPSRRPQAPLPRAPAAREEPEPHRPEHSSEQFVCSSGLGDLPVGDPDDLAAAVKKKKGRIRKKQK